jgi:hypothetical protein
MYTLLGKVRFLLICCIALTNASSVRAQNNTDLFYEALSKTQQQKFTAAADSLDALASKFQRQGDRVNAYRSRAAALAVRLEGNDAAKFKKNGKRNTPDWYVTYNCLEFNNNKYMCRLGSYIHPIPDNSKNMGGIIALTNTLERIPSKSGEYEDVEGFLDIVAIPKLRQSEFVADNCRIMSGIHKGGRAVALTTNSIDQYSKYINTNNRLAWHADNQAKRFKSIDPKIVECTPRAIG